MFYQDYLRLKKIKDKLVLRLKEQEQCANQVIRIRDVFAFAVNPELSFGEFEHDKTPLLENYFIIRLIDHLKFLAYTANRYHQQYYCNAEADGTYKIKTDCLNNITRLLLPEFSLYTPRPFTLDEFSDLLNMILLIAEQQHDNVHLLLSSFALLLPNSDILNISLYVQCGSNAHIQAFAKAMAADRDKHYPSTNIFDQTFELDIKPGVTVPFVGGRKNIVISSQSVFLVQTLGGAQYTQAVDVCIDHAFEHAKTLFMQQVRHDTLETSLIPHQVDHVLTSNALNIDPSSLLSQDATHIDPRLTKAELTGQIQERILLSHLTPPIAKKYPETNITKFSPQDFIVEKPPFGFNYYIMTGNERTLSHYTPILMKELTAHNQQSRKNRLIMIMSQLDHFEEFRFLYHEADHTLQAMRALYRQLENLCEPSVIESLLLTKNLKAKYAVKRVICLSWDSFNLLRVDPYVLLGNIHRFIQDLVNDLLAINHRLPNDFISTLITTIHQTQSQLPNPKRTNTGLALIPV